MPLPIRQAALIVAAAAVCTLFTRALPFLFFGGKREVPKTVKYLGTVLPPAIIATLVVYCVKSVDIFSASHGLPELISIGLVAGLHLWKKNTLLSVGAGTLCYMLLVQFVFV